MNDLDIIVRLKFGSHLYGTNSETSDEDFKGVFLPTKEEVLLGKVPKSYNFTTKPKGSEDKNTSEDIDTEIYSLHYFLKLALEGQTVAIDMLHAPDNMIMEKDNKGIWDYLVNHRGMFYTKNLKAFVGYARKQAAKYGIKGSRLDAARQVVNTLKRVPLDWKLDTFWKTLPVGEHQYFVEDSPNGIKQYQVCGKILQSTQKIGYTIEILEKFIDQYGKRALLAESNIGIDFKAVSHAIRAAMQIKEIFLNNDIVFPLKEAKFLKEVKLGTLDYNTIVSPRLEGLMDEIEVLSENSTLPSKPDYKFWEEWLCFVLEDNLFA